MTGVTAAVVDSGLLVAGIAMLSVAGAAASRMLLPSDGPLLDRAFVSMVVAIGELLVVMQVLGLLHILVLSAVLGAELLLAVASAWWVWGRGDATTSSGLSKPSPEWAVALLACAFAGALALAMSLRQAPTDLDTVHYHIVNAADWLRGATIWDLPFSFPGEYQGTVPGNGELVGTWLMLPTGNDAFAYTESLFFAALSIAGIGVLTRELGGRDWHGILLGLGAVATPLVFWTHVNGLLTDMAAAAGCTAAVAVALLGIRGRVAAWPVLAGVALGLAAGSKYVALAPVALSLVAILALTPVARGRTALLIVGSSLPLAGVWYLRNWVLTGNPVFPIEVKLGGHVLFAGGGGPINDIQTTLLTHALNGRSGVLGSAGHLALQYMGPALIVAGAGTVCALLSGIRGDRRRAIVAALAIGCFAAYVATPISGGGPDGLEFLIGSNLRYMLPALLVGTAVAAASIPEVLVVLLAVAALAYDAEKIVQGPGFRRDLGVDSSIVAVTIALVGLAAAATLALPAIRRFSLGRRWLLVAGGAIAVTALLASAPSMRDVRTAPPQSVVDRALASTGHPDGTVAVIGVHNIRIILAPDFHTRLVGLGDGTPGALTPILTAAGLDDRLAAVAPDVLVVGNDPVFIRPPSGWHPPSGWKQVGQQNGAAVYTRATP